MGRRNQGENVRKRHIRGTPWLGQQELNGGWTRKKGRLWNSKSLGDGKGRVPGNKGSGVSLKPGEPAYLVLGDVRGGGGGRGGQKS